MSSYLLTKFSSYDNMSRWSNSLIIYLSRLDILSLESVVDL